VRYRVTLGIAIPKTFLDARVDPRRLQDFLRRADALGFHSAWVVEQILDSSATLAPIELPESARASYSSSVRRLETSSATSAAQAIPALEDMNCRRLTPRRRALRRAVSAISAATRGCSCVWSSGRYSSLETTCVGSGENPSVSTSCARFQVQRRESHSCSLVRGHRGSACRAVARSMSRSPGTLTPSGANRPPTATPPGSGP
jgi:hypothetical protein